MRKKHLLLLGVALLSTLTTRADHFQSGDLYYDFTSDTTVEVVEPSYWDSTDYQGLTIVTIPATVTYYTTTYSVTSIGRGAFDGCDSLTSVTIGNSVTNIGERAFGACVSLTSVTIGNSVTSIGREAFYACYSLTSVTIPNSVTSIGYSAFGLCSSLTSVTIGNSVTSIGKEAFWNCFALTSIVVESGNTMYDSRNNCNAIIETATNTLVFGCQSTIIPESVTSIGEKAFYWCTSLTSVTIGNSVTNIGEEAFCGCLFTSVTIPNSVTSIGGWAFYDCSALTKLICSGHVENIGQGVLFGCHALDTVAISAQAFDVSEGNWLYLPKNIRYIKVAGGELTDDAFNVILRSYKTLGTLDLAAATNTTLSDKAFYECYNLQTLTLPSQLQVVPYKAVADCQLLQSVTIPATVEEIGNSAFENCRSLSEVTFEDGIALERIGGWAFYNCHDLQSITIPEGVTEIGDAAFYGCNYLQDLSLPGSLRKIGDNTFALCSKLQKMQVDAAVPPAVESKTFLDVLRTIPVIVPDEAVADYKAAEVWKEFNIIGESNAPMAVGNTRDDNAQGVRKVVHDGQVVMSYT